MSQSNRGDLSPAARAVEAILFVSGEPLSPAGLATAAGLPEEDVAAALEQLAGALEGHGLHLLETSGEYLLATAPDTHVAVETYLKQQVKVELTKPALETLAIIAYKQPVTKSQIEDIRGVSSDQTLRNLMQRGLVKESGRSPSPGRPTLYSVTPKFLQHAGISNLGELPPLELPGESPAN